MTDFWLNKVVLVTGHTGFKGTWLCCWLLKLGAKVVGVSLDYPSSPSLFEQMELEPQLVHYVADIRDQQRLREIIVEISPDVLFHLAAQPLVRSSYDEPLYTWETNVLGTIHVLEALRCLHHPCAAVLITTDKCYENREWVYGYRETDALGGYDPYSSSKAAAEIAIASWRRSFFNKPDNLIGIASARAGNVIGGGDWALDRIVPDAMRSLEKGDIIPVRNPRATRPWQHVLEPLSGYLLLAEQIYKALLNHQRDRLQMLCTAFNFGPKLEANRSVQELVTEILKYWPGEWKDFSNPNALHEAGLLNLVTDKAYHTLGWQPRWDFETTVLRTTTWYAQVLKDPSKAHAQVLEDIRFYEHS